MMSPIMNGATTALFLQKLLLTYPEQRILLLWDRAPWHSGAPINELLEANPGDVVFFDSYVPHGSPANTSNAPRRNIYLTFNRKSAGDLRMRYYHDKWKSYPPNKPGQGRSSGSYRV